MNWHCEVCDKTILRSSRNRHLLSKRHLLKSEQVQSIQLHPPVPSPPPVVQLPPPIHPPPVQPPPPVQQYWHCNICEKTIKASSRSNHLKTKTHKHIMNQKSILSLINEEEEKEIVDPREKECEICYEPSVLVRFKSCKRCCNNWCGKCHIRMRSSWNSSLHRCPFCRKQFTRKENFNYIPI